MGTCPRIGFFGWRPEIHWFRVASSPWPVIHMAKTGPSLPSDKTENVNYMRYTSFPMLLFFPDRAESIKKLNILIHVSNVQTLLWIAKKERKENQRTDFYIKCLIIPHITVQIQI